MHLKKFKRPNKTLEMVNLIPMINLIFLLLIFFLLTGVVSKKDSNEISRPESEFGNEVEINNQKQISNQQNKDQLMILYLKKDKIFFEDKIIKLKDLENKYFDDWNAQNFDKIVILNDKKSSIQVLFNLMDLIKKKK